MTLKKFKKCSHLMVMLQLAFVFVGKEEKRVMEE